jgi:hypothetical protein
MGIDMAIATDARPRARTSAGSARLTKPPVGRLLDATLRIYLHRWRPHLTTSIMAQAPVLLPTVVVLELLSEATSALDPGSSDLNGPAVLLSVLLLFLAFASAFFFVLMSGAASQLVEYWLDGRPVSVRAAYGVALRRFWRLAVAMLVVFGLICVALVLLAGAVAVASASYVDALDPVDTNRNAALLLVVSLGIVLVVSAFLVDALVRWAVFVQAVIIEGAGPIWALRRSAELVKHRWRRTAVIMAIFTLLPALATMGVGVIGGILLSPLAVLGLPGPLISGLAGAVAQLAFSPLPAIGVTVLFYALRDDDAWWERIWFRIAADRR